MTLSQVYNENERNVEKEGWYNSTSNAANGFMRMIFAMTLMAVSLYSYITRTHDVYKIIYLFIHLKIQWCL